jgi:HK97 family phage major capsid protein
VTAPAIPQTPEELAEFVYDRKKVGELLNSDDKTAWPKFLTEYANKVNRVDKDINRQVEEQVEQTLAAWQRENGAALKRPDMSPATAKDITKMSARDRQTGSAFMQKRPGHDLNGKFASLMEFLNAVDGDPRDEVIGPKRKLIKDAMSSTDPSLGGFLVPDEFRTEMLQLSLSDAVVRPRAMVIPMTTLRVQIPIVDVTSNVSSVFGGIVGYWTEEGAAMTGSQPRFGRVGLEAKKLTAYTEVPNELREDSNPSAEAFLRMSFPKAIAWFEDIAFLTGSGAGEPLGVFNTLNNAIVAQPKEVGQGTGTIFWENIVGMYARMLPSSLNSAVWVVAPDTLPQLMTTALNVGTGGAPIGMSNFDGHVGPTLSLLGRPVVISEKVSALSTQGDINFVDFGQYLIGDRMSMSAELSTDYKFGNDVTAFRFIERVDGRPWIQSAITPKNNSTSTLSPYVQLATR